MKHVFLKQWRTEHWSETHTHLITSIWKLYQRKEFEFHCFVLILINIDKFYHLYYGFHSVREILKEYQAQNSSQSLFSCENLNFIIIGDAIVAGLTRYNNVQNNLFGNRFINLGISGERARDIVVILCGTNNINKDPPYDVVQGLIAIRSVFKNQSSNPNIFICGILPRYESFLIIRLIINEVNNLLKDTINPLELFVEKRQFFSQNNEWLNKIIYH